LFLPIVIQTPWIKNESASTLSFGQPLGAPNRAGNYATVGHYPQISVKTKLPKPGTLIARYYIKRKFILELYFDPDCTRPETTERLVRDCADPDIHRVWMHRSLEFLGSSVSEEAVNFCRKEWNSSNRRRLPYDVLRAV
jgi:hypothetical protein